MSSTTTRKSCMTDIDCLRAAVDNVPGARMDRPLPGNKNRYWVQLPSARAHGPKTIGVNVDISDGKVYYDSDYTEALRDSMNALHQEYSTEICRRFAQANGSSMVSERLLSGEVKIKIAIGGSAPPVAANSAHFDVPV